MFSGVLRNKKVELIEFTSPADATRHARMVSFVNAMLDLHRQLAVTRTAEEKTAIQRIIEATHREIDKVVYELYGLTEEEIGIVEVLWIQRFPNQNSLLIITEIHHSLCKTSHNRDF